MSVKHLHSNPQLALKDCAQIIHSLGSPQLPQQLLQLLQAYVPCQTLQIHRLHLTPSQCEIDDVEYFGAASLGACPLAMIEEGGKDLLLRYPLYNRECPDIQRLKHVSKDDEIWISKPEAIDSDSLRDFYFEHGYFRQFAVYAGRIEQQLYVLWLGRLNHDADFNDDDIKQLNILSELYLPLLVKHAQAFEAQLSLKQRPVDLQRKILQQLERHAVQLSKRELEVCLGILQGRQAPEMAEQMGVAKTSIATYKKRAFEKLGVSTQQQLFDWCFLRPVV